MTIADTLKKWDEVKDIAARNQLTVELDEDRLGDERIVVRNRHGVALRRLTTLSAVLNWFDGYESGRNRERRSHASPT